MAIHWHREQDPSLQMDALLERLKQKHERLIHPDDADAVKQKPRTPRDPVRANPPTRQA